jgi:hypothetical protein
MYVRTQASTLTPTSHLTSYSIEAEDEKIFRNWGIGGGIVLRGDMYVLYICTLGIPYLGRIHSLCRHLLPI